MNRTLIFTFTIFLVGNILIGQEISNETLKAIKDADIAVLDRVISKESLNNCYDVKNSSYNYLAMSIKMKQIKSVKYFTEKGADLEAVCTGKTPLMYAVKYGQLEMVKYLINAGAKIEAKTDKGRNALDYAAKYEQVEIAKYLKESLKY
ncbi:MAG: ankyrin repeat domain-containing protein [Bacteroidota bacterium]